MFRIIGIIVEEIYDFTAECVFACVVGLFFGGVFLISTFYVWYYLFTHLSEYVFLEILPFLVVLVGTVLAAFIFDSFSAGIFCACILGTIFLFCTNSFSYPDSLICKVFETVVWNFIWAGAGVIPSSIGYAVRNWLF